MTLSDLEARLTAYLGLRKALGIPVGTGTATLQRFVKFAGDQASEAITSQVVFDWLDAEKAHHSSGKAANRLSLVRQFLLYLSATTPDTQVPETRLVAGYRRPAPFVFTQDETERLLRSAADFKPGEFCSVVLHTIIGLIASTGLRASEALALDRADTMPRSSPGTLLIREAKFHKSRIVPLHPSTVEQLRVYIGHRELLGYSQYTTALFVSPGQSRLSYERLRKCFGAILQKADIRPRPGCNPPTLHSLRHTFVVSRLRRWHEEGTDVQNRLAHLATYLGHVDYHDTYWYMTATPELLTAATVEFIAPRGVGGDQ
jgi:integrase/recombinase XerD